MRIHVLALLSLVFILSCKTNQASRPENTVKGGGSDSDGPQVPELLNNYWKLSIGGDRNKTVRIKRNINNKGYCLTIINDVLMEDNNVSWNPCTDDPRVANPMQVWDYPKQIFYIASNNGENTDNADITTLDDFHVYTHLKDRRHQMQAFALSFAEGANISLKHIGTKENMLSVLNNQDEDKFFTKFLKYPDGTYRVENPIVSRMHYCFNEKQTDQSVALKTETHTPNQPVDADCARISLEEAHSPVYFDVSIYPTFVPGPFSGGSSAADSAIRMQVLGNIQDKCIAYNGEKVVTASCNSQPPTFIDFNYNYMVFKGTVRETISANTAKGVLLGYHPKQGVYLRDYNGTDGGHIFQPIPNQKAYYLATKTAGGKKYLCMTLAKDGQTLGAIEVEANRMAGNCQLFSIIRGSQG